MITYKKETNLVKTTIYGLINTALNSISLFLNGVLSSASSSESDSYTKEKDKKIKVGLYTINNFAISFHVKAMDNFRHVLDLAENITSCVFW